MLNINLKTLKFFQQRGTIVKPAAAGSSYVKDLVQQNLANQVVSDTGKKVVVQTGNPIVKTPDGVMDGVTALTLGETPPSQINVEIDSDLATANTKVVIGSLLPYQVAIDDPAFENPVGYVTSNDKEVTYKFFLAELCSKTYVVNTIKQTVNPSRNSTATTDSVLPQLDRTWERHWTDGQGQSGKANIYWQNEDNPFQFKGNTRTAPVGQSFGKLDMYSCYVIPVMPKVFIRISLFVTARALLA